jgi:hypothetical protein
MARCRPRGPVSRGTHCQSRGWLTPGYGALYPLRGRFFCGFFLRVFSQLSWAGSGTGKRLTPSGGICPGHLFGASSKYCGAAFFRRQSNVGPPQVASRKKAGCSGWLGCDSLPRGLFYIPSNSRICWVVFYHLGWSLRVVFLFSNRLSWPSRTNRKKLLVRLPFAGGA